ncbi:MAG: P27 family phage terminase small subunit [Eubacteriales bacterium]|nr:P27 family phage terminase small subunit [Eubacteriales bacterium]
MNDKIREQHLKNVTDARAVEMYDKLCDDYERQYGALSEGAQSIIADIAVMEQQKRALNADVAERGAMEEFHNGRQHFWRENKAIQAARALAEQQRKHLNELKLTPASQSVNPDTVNDDFNSF